MPSIMMAWVLLLGLTIVGVSTYLWQHAGSQEFVRAKIGIVGDAQGDYLGFGLDALQSMDSSRFSLELIQMEESEAKQHLAQGNIVAYVVLPEDFVNRVIYGENPEIRMVSNGVSGLTAVVTQELTSAISIYLLQSEGAIYAMQDIAYLQGDVNAYGSTADRFFLRLMGGLLSREQSMQVHLLGLGENMSFGRYYLHAVLIMLVFLWGFACFSVLTHKQLAISRCMQGRGITGALQYAIETLAYFLLTLVFFAVTVLLLMAVMSLMPESVLGILGLEKAGVGVFASLFIPFVPVVFMVCALQKGIYELSGNPIAALLNQLLIFLVLGFAGGLFYPISFFPRILQTVGRVLPLGAGMGLSAGNNSALYGVLTLLYGICFVFLGCLHRRRELQ